MRHFATLSLRHRTACGLLTAAIVWLASGLPAARPQADRSVPFRAGETLTYDISWTTFVTAGQATLSVRERQAIGGSRAEYYLVAEGRPSSMLQKLYHLYYKAESMLDTRTLRPHMATIYSDENGRKRYKTSTFRGNGLVDYEIRTASTSRSQIKVPPEAQDPLGAIYVLRAVPMQVGMRPFNIPVTDSGKVYTMRVIVDGRETVRTGLGPIPGLRLRLLVNQADGTATDEGNLTLWISDDARWLPLKFTAGLAVGSFQLTLSRVTG